MQILITRHRKTKETIDGSLSINGSLRLCDTAENAATALPPGTYPIIIKRCHQYARKMPIVLIHKDALPPNPPVSLQGAPASIPSPLSPNCSLCRKLDCVTVNSKLPQVCPMLKPGNGVYHREDGSIILGTFLVSGCLKHSRDAFNSLYDRLRKANERGNDISLTIEDQC